MIYLYLYIVLGYLSVGCAVLIDPEPWEDWWKHGITKKSLKFDRVALVLIGTLSGILWLPILISKTLNR